jgi:hypothetical protein
VNVRYYVLWKGEVPKDLDPDFVGKVLTWNELMSVGANKYKPENPADLL